MCCVFFFGFAFQIKVSQILNFFYLKLIFCMFLNCFDVLISKIIFSLKKLF